MDIEKDTWSIIDAYFRDTKDYLVKHHIDSYNDFINRKIPLIFMIQSKTNIMVTFRLILRSFCYIILLLRPPYLRAAFNSVAHTVQTLNNAFSSNEGIRTFSLLHCSSTTAPQALQ